MACLRFDDGRIAIERVWYPKNHGRRRFTASEFFNIAAGLRPDDRLLGREHEVVGCQIVIKVIYERQPDGTEKRKIYFFPPQGH